MGDRANIIVQQEDNNHIYLYTHWGGYKVEEILALALKRSQDRWDDTPYLTRIIFSEMLKGTNLDDRTGYGISTTHCEPGNDLWVNTHRQYVQINKTGPKITFEKFIERTLS